MAVHSSISVGAVSSKDQHAVSEGDFTLAAVSPSSLVITSVSIIVPVSELWPRVFDILPCTFVEAPSDTKVSTFISATLSALSVTITGSRHGRRVFVKYVLSYLFVGVFVMMMMKSIGVSGDNRVPR